MKAFGRFCFYVTLAVILVFWTVFTVYNTDAFSFKFLNWNSIPLPIAIWLMVAFVIGTLCGILLCASGYFKGKATQKRLLAELDESRHPSADSAGAVSTPVEVEDHMARRPE